MIRKLLSSALFMLLITASAQDMMASTHKLFVSSATISDDLGSVTLPFFEGSTADGRSFLYVVTESSDEMDAAARGVNHAPKLKNAAMSPAVQAAEFNGEMLLVRATVDFSPEHVVVPGMGSSPFPPAEFAPGSVGEEGYSPLVELASGIILNASHIANSSGQHDKVISIDMMARTVTLALTAGFYEGEVVHYVSLDASTPLAAALEAVTYAPALGNAPGQGSNEESSSRSGLAIFTNGQTGGMNPERQGLNSVLSGDEGGPLNIVQSVPLEPDYSPLWDAYMAVWDAEAVMGGMKTLQTDFEAVQALAEMGMLKLSGLDGMPFGASGFVVNCPIILITHNTM